MIVTHNGKTHSIHVCNGAVYSHTQSTCRRKHSFTSRAKARKAIKQWHVRGTFNPYYCVFCGGWHLGTRSDEDQKADSVDPERV